MNFDETNTKGITTLEMGKEPTTTRNYKEQDFHQSDLNMNIITSPSLIRGVGSRNSVIDQK